MGGRKEAVHDWSWTHRQPTLLGDPSISRGPYSGLGCTGSGSVGFSCGDIACQEEVRP